MRRYRAQKIYHFFSKNANDSKFQVKSNSMPELLRRAIQSAAIPYSSSFSSYLSIF